MNKTERHEALLARARKAVNAMYHNATLDFPSDMSNAHCEWFNQACSDEIDHLNGGGAYGNLDSMRKYFASIHKSTAAGRYHYAKHLREKAFEQERYARYERITEYGSLYTWGRGGATLAPDKLVQQRGGSSFSLSCESFEHMDWGQITRLTLTVEAFNKYVAQWCSKENISFMLSEQIAYEQAEKEEAEQDVYADWEERYTPMGSFNFDEVEYRIAPEDPMDAWREALFETFLKHVPNDRRAGVAGRFNEVFAQRPPQKTMLSAAQVRDVWMLIYAYAARCIDASKLGYSMEALKDRTSAHTTLSEWFKANSCD